MTVEIVCKRDTDGDGNCPVHSDCATLTPWKEGEQVPKKNSAPDWMGDSWRD